MKVYLQRSRKVKAHLLIVREKNINGRNMELHFKNPQAAEINVYKEKSS